MPIKTQQRENLFPGVNALIEDLRLKIESAGFFTAKARKGHGGAGELRSRGAGERR